MILSLIRSSTYQELLLPAKPIGRFEIFTQLRGEKKAILIVDGNGAKWFLHSTTEADVLDAERQVLAVTVLEENEIYSIYLHETKSKAYLFTHMDSITRGVFEKVCVKSGDVVRIGRKPNNHFVCNNRFISGTHAQLTYNAGLWTVVDTDSSNGVFVNGQKVQRQQLIPGDVVSIMEFKLIPLGNILAYNNPNQFVCVNDLTPCTPSILEDNSSGRVDLREEKIFSVKPRVLDPIIEENIQVEMPPQKLEEDDTPAILVMGPSITMGLSSAVTGLTSVITAASSSNVLSVIPTIVMSISMLAGSLFWPKLNRKYTAEKRAKQEQKRKEVYTEYLNSISRRMDHFLQQQQERLLLENPSGESAIQKALSDETSLWQRRNTDRDFLCLRLGLGSCKTMCKVTFPEEKFPMQEDEMKSAMNRLKERSLTLEKVPILWKLSELSIVGAVGSTVDVTAFAHSLILQLAAEHGSDDVKLSLLYTEKQKQIYDAYRWLPHVWSYNQEIRFVATNTEEAETLAMYFAAHAPSNHSSYSESDKEETQYVFLMMDQHLAESTQLLELIHNEKNKNYHAICCYHNSTELPKWTETYVELHDGKGVLSWTDGKAHDDGAYQVFSTDGTVSAELKNRACKLLATLRLKTKAVEETFPESISLLELFQISDIHHLNLSARWRESNPIKTLRAPIGMGENGCLSYLDIHQRAHGPHGLIAGMTGSGKSEFILTYLLSMAMSYSPNEVAFVLIDYKGGGMAKALEALPHTVGVITNLDGNGIHRSLVAIESELKRRQQIFEETRLRTGSTNIDIYSYQQMYRSKKVAEPLPHLILVSDEFAELKMQQPEFMDQLISAARIGRSLGVHLILATQKPSGVVNDQIWSNSRFRVCLKVQDAGDSNDMLKRPDAANLTTTGRYYLQVGYNEVFALGQGAYSGAAYTPFLPYSSAKQAAVDVIDNLGGVLCHQAREIHSPVPGKELEKQMDVATAYIIETAKALLIQKHMLWQPPLEETIPIETLRKKYTVTIQPYLYEPIIGELDDPYTQSKRLLTCPVSEGKNMALYGAAGSGKFQFLQTMLVDLISSHSYEEIRLFLLDFADDGLEMFASAPQVGAVILQNEEERLRSLFKLLREEIETRKPAIAAQASEKTIAAKLCKAKLCTMLVVIHHWAVFQENYEASFADDVLYCLREGPRYGIQFFVTGLTVNTISYRYQQYFGRSYVLQMNHDDDYSAILGRTGKLIPAKVKGRGLVVQDQVYEFQTAIFTKNISSFCDKIREHSNLIDQKQAEIPQMPEKVNAELLAPILDESQPMRFPIGVDTEHFRPVLWQMDQRPIQLIAGESSKSAGVIHGLWRLLEHANEPSITVLDATGMLDDEVKALCTPEEWKIIVRKLFKKCIEQNRLLKEGTLKKGFDLFVFSGIKEIFTILDDPQDEISLMEIENTTSGSKDADDKHTYAYWLKFLLEMLKEEWKNIILLVDSTENIQRLRWERWYRAKLDDKNGLLLGAFAGQCVLNVNGVTPWKKQKQQFGYLVQNGTEIEIKYLFD